MGGYVLAASITLFSGGGLKRNVMELAFLAKSDAFELNRADGTTIKRG